jgi:pyridinium-3,5-bisthiocarboxylic acid mononucleotide nickel chelatase
MKTLYLDIFSGISGDMFIGALLDLGVPLEQLERELAKLGLDEYHIHATRKQKSSIEGVKFDVHAHEHGHEPHSHEHEGEQDHAHAHAHGHHHHEHGPGQHAHSHDPLSLDLRQHQPHDRHEHGPHEHEHGRTFREIRALIQGSKLSPWVKENAVAVFSRIARAEGKIHGQPPEEVHFHEVGAIDSIVDIVGACAGLELLGKPRVLSSPVTEGTGFVRCAHGRFPIPAPATIAILAERGVPISQCDEPHELVTPTGAAILAEFAEQFGPISGLVPEKIGYGLGERDNQTRPNVLRALLGASTIAPGGHDWETDQVAVLETNLDDINSEIIGHVVEKAFREGALDVFHTPIQMKKNRPGVLLTILCASGDADRFSELLLRETTALGVRRTAAERRKLRREIVTVETAFGPVEVKIGRLDGKKVQASPEFESCRKIAEARGIALKEVYTAAITAAAHTLK